MSTSSLPASPARACSNRSWWTSSKDPFGLPRAGRSGETDDEGHKVWKQLDLWSYGTHALNIEIRLEDTSPAKWQGRILQLVREREVDLEHGDFMEMPVVDSEAGLPLAQWPGLLPS
jgi:hypothetical protein